MKIAFITDGFPHSVKVNTYKMLQKLFPDSRIDWINTLDIAKKNKFISFLNIFFIIKEYWAHYFFGKKPFLFYFFRTTFIFKQIKKRLNKIISKEKYDFTFQMMLMFDASTDNIPNFTYNDVTHLTYESFPVYNKWHQNSNKWIELEKEIYKNAAINFLWSQNIAKDMRQLYGIDTSKIKVVGVGGNVCPNNADDLLKLERYKRKRILFVGYDWERKGGDYLYQAFKKVLILHKDAKLIIVGANPDLDTLSGSVEIWGRQNAETVARLFESASIFCMPTLREPFGLVFIEAMSYGLPLVAWNMGALPELIGNEETGILAKPLNAEDLAGKLSLLLDNPSLCLAMGKQGIDKTREFYNWDIVGDKIKSEILKTLSAYNRHQNQFSFITSAI